MDKAVRAPHGKKMIEVRVRFWTSNLAEESGMVLPGEAWASGVVLMETNASHGIVPQSPTPFGSLMELPGTIEKVLIKHGIRLHLTDKMVKYLD